MRAGDGDERLAGSRCRVGDDLLPRLGRDAQPGRARSSALSGSTAVSALVTASRSGRLPGSPAHVVGSVLPFERECRPRSTAARVGRRTARIAATDLRSGVVGVQNGCRCAGAGGAKNMDPLAGPDRSRWSRRRQATTDLGGGTRHATESASRWASSISSAARALLSLLALRSPSQTKRRTSWPCSSATPTYVRPTGLAGVPPPRAGDAGHRDGQRRSEAGARTICHGDAGLCGHGAMAFERHRIDAQLRLLDRVAIADDAADVVVARAADLGDQVADRALPCTIRQSRESDRARPVAD